MIPVLDGIATLADRYDAFILDIWGVLHNGMRVYNGVIPCLKELKARNKQILLLSNSPDRGAVVVKHILTPMGLTPDLYDHIVTSGDSTFEAMTGHSGQNVYCFYDREDPTALINAPVNRVYSPEDADFGLLSLLPGDAVEDDYTAILQQCRDQNMPLICANPDKFVNRGDDIHICAGAIADLYEAMGGAVSWHGKPHKAIYDRAFDCLNRPDKAKVLAIGDSLRTDVAGALDYGMDVLWNAVGIHWQEITDGGVISQDKIRQAVNHLPAHPTAILHGLAW